MSILSQSSNPNGYLTGEAARRAVRAGEWRSPTSGLAPGFVQANLVVLPRENAFDFLRFCFLNPRPCPLLDVTEPGSPHPSSDWAAQADLRTDIPRYRVYQRGELVAEPTDLLSIWRGDFVSFLIGCSFTFEEALLQAGVPVRHQECGCNVPMYRTNIPTRSSGIFSGPTVVSMRPVPGRLVPLAVTVTARFPTVHGAPIHVGDPDGLGIADIHHPDYGDPVPIHPDELPVFWACGVTPQAVAQAARVPYMITHSPGHMFISDRLNSTLTDR